MKSYSAYTSFKFKLLMLVFYPVAACAGCAIVMSGFFHTIRPNGFHYLVPIGILPAAIVLVETIMDYWIFKGAFSKNVEVFNFLKTSCKGSQIYRNALLFNEVRRLITIIAIFAADVLIGVFCFKQEWDVEAVSFLIQYLTLSFLISSFATFISRFSSLIWMNMIVSYVAFFLSFIMNFVLGKMNVSESVSTYVFAGVALIISVFNVILPLRKLEKSYND